MKYSIVIPVYNEGESLDFLRDSLYQAMDQYKDQWEVIFVDDGSSDDSYKHLEKFAQSDPDRIMVLSFRRNFGQTAAIAAGIDYAQGQLHRFVSLCHSS